jgi:ELWxxDGT repeat protein
MKKTLHLVLTACSALMLHQQSMAQATLVSNNTYLNEGLVLPGSNRPILFDHNDNEGLWTTNGTTATRITTAVTHPDSTDIAFFNNRMYFTGSDASGDAELWVTDGTAAGTKRVVDINPNGSSVPDDYFVFNNTLYFTANDGRNGRELWKSNGADGNATLVTNINSGSADGLDEGTLFFQNGNTVFFTVTSGANPGLWKLDLSGTPTLVRNIPGNISLIAGDCAALGNKTVFTVRTGSHPSGTTQMWVTDGTANGTQLLKDFGTGSGSLTSLQLTPFKGLLFFDGIQSGNIELWTTDGTAANTKLFKTDGPSYPYLSYSALINGKLFFGAYTEAKGFELWSTDGTANGTTLFKDINTQEDDNGYTGDANPFFLINIGAYINQFTGTGTAGNINFQQATTPFKGKWYFIADDGEHGQELWATDGTPGGTQMVTDLNKVVNEDGDATEDGVPTSNMAYYTTTGIYFVGNNGSSGEEPFVTDGTANGTKLVADINTNPGEGSNPDFMFVLNNQIYLNANNVTGDGFDDNPNLYKINQTVVLPASLLSFNVALRDGSVAVNWTTASEVNTRNFVVERSTDGVHFNALGTVTAAGNSNTARQYQFTDASAMQAGASTLYYRLRTVDNDGKYAYTAILPVQLQGGIFRISLSPNPVRNQLSVAFSTGNAKTATLRVTDANGKVIYQQQFQTNGVASMQQYINVSNYAAGSYFVQLVTDKDTKTAQFVKQ